MVPDEDIPSEIIFSYQITSEDKEIFEKWLSNKKGRKVLINPTMI